jgi:NADH:ubiquinone oxidoreductase subunit H
MIHIVSILLIVAFFTLRERKILARVQRRHGPMYVGYNGMLQPFADRIKLIFKEIILPRNTFKFFFFFAPRLNFFTRCFLWLFIPISNYAVLVSPYSVFFFYIFGSMNIYRIVLAGWASQSRYSLLASLRSISQMLAYELPLSLCFIGFRRLQSQTLDITKFTVGAFFLNFPLCLIALICFFAETNRTPFDLPEAEAELVAGYNVEYSGLPFALFFLSEYRMILLNSSLCSIFFFGSFSIIITLRISVFFIIIRRILPRFRFDQVLELRWAKLLPLRFSFLYLECGLLFYLK